MIVSEMAATRTEVAAENGLVTGGDMRECEAGIAMLRAGGNAIDAVVAAAFVGFVVEPSSCGIGGYGRLALFLADRKKFITVDHYVRAPAAARPDMYRVDPTKPAKYYGFPHTEGLEAEVGHRAVAVPGAVTGLCAAHEKLGCLKLAQVLEPAIAIAEAGLPVTWQLALGIAERLAEIRRFPSIAALLLRQDAPPRAPGQFGGADRLDCRDLARTLRRVAELGPAGFCDGPVAAAIERECRAHGGILTAADLATYRPRIFEEKPFTYRGLAYTTADDLVAYEALNILERFDLAGMGADSVGFRHVMAEALAAAFADNMMHYGDPEFVTSPIKGLGSKDFAAARAAGIRLDRALPRPVVPADPWPFDGGTPPAGPRGASRGKIEGTSQMAAVDRWGNMASLITSLSSGFGSLVMVPETGIILNNSMQNFDPRPDRANAIAPGKMPIFAAPALVAAQDGTAVFAGCGSGGYRIETGVLHAFVHNVDFAMGAQAAVDAPRVHCQGQQTFVDGRIAADTRAELAAMGHHIVVQQDSPGLNAFGRINAIAVDPKTRIMRAGTGPAWNTAAAGY